MSIQEKKYLRAILHLHVHSLGFLKDVRISLQYTFKMAGLAMFIFDDM